MTGDLTTGGWHATGTAARHVPARQQHRSGVGQRGHRRAGGGADRAVPSGCPCWCPARCRRCGTPGRAGSRPTEENTPTGARENIHRHYDLSNDLFELFLDPTLTYSAAWFEPGDDLQTAQLRKIDGILDLARVQPGQRVLEIGSGWGGLAIRAVQERDVHVTTLTLSEAQKELAERRIAEAGLSDRIDVLLEDYRHHAGRDAGHLRRDRQRRDDRGRRRAVLAGLLRRDRPDARPTAAG